jgi:hypothetical protein
VFLETQPVEWGCVQCHRGGKRKNKHDDIYTFPAPKAHEYDRNRQVRRKLTIFGYSSSGYHLRYHMGQRHPFVNRRSHKVCGVAQNYFKNCWWLWKLGRWQNTWCTVLIWVIRFCHNTFLLIRVILYGCKDGIAHYLLMVGTVFDHMYVLRIIWKLKIKIWNFKWIMINYTLIIKIICKLKIKISNVDCMISKSFANLKSSFAMMKKI